MTEATFSETELVAEEIFSETELLAEVIFSEIELLAAATSVEIELFTALTVALISDEIEVAFKVVLAVANSEEIELEAAETFELTRELIEEARGVAVDIIIDDSDALDKTVLFAAMALDTALETALDNEEMSELISAFTDEATLESELMTVGTMLLLSLITLLELVALITALEIEASIEDNAAEAELTRADTLELIASLSIEVAVAVAYGAIEMEVVILEDPPYNQFFTGSNMDHPLFDPATAPLATLPVGGTTTTKEG